MITSGYYLRDGRLVSTVTSSNKDLLLTECWQSLYHNLPLRAFLFILTRFSLMQNQTDKLCIQLTGLPSLLSSSVKSSKPISFSLNSILYQTGFSRHCGLPGRNPIKQLWRLNVRLNGCDVALTSNLMNPNHGTTVHNQKSTPYVYKKVRRDVVQILVHESLRDCYASWRRKNLKEEMENVERYATNRHSVLLKTPPRFEEYEKYLGRLLWQSQLVDYHGLLNHYAKLPEYHNQQENPSYWEDVITQESIPMYRRTSHHSSESHSGEHLIEHIVSRECVFGFVKDCLKRLLSRQLLGSRHNWHQLLLGVHRFVYLEYGEVITLDQIMERIRLSEVHWIQPRGKPTAKDNLHSMHLFKRFLHFLFRYLIVSIRFHLSHRFHSVPIISISLPLLLPLSCSIVNHFIALFFISISIRIIMQTFLSLLTNHNTRQRKSHL